MMKACAAIFLSLWAVTSSAGVLQSTAGPIQVTKMIDGLDTPWAVGILPNGDFVVTERDGELLYVKGGIARPISGVPKVAALGQGGLLDVTIARDFSRTREIFLTFARPQRSKAGTALAIARLSENGDHLTGVQVIFEALPGGSRGNHFGSRVVEALDGTLFVTVGDHGNKPAVQSKSNHLGTLVRINRDGTVPVDNPYVGNAGVRPEIWSYGHRNPQGAHIDQEGRLWVSEHGAKGGDEINLIRPGANYGWPVISYGTFYSGEKIGEGTSKPGMEQPAHYWDPSIAPSGLMVYSGELWPQWNGNLFVGSLKFGYIARISGAPLQEVEQIKGPATERVRDIVEAPDGSIWFISVGNGAVYRMTPSP
ncbi:PQQ-dependent sugar dehydrogenase [uncultured Ruegeria sp.]|uniref:PQQ-dependent sugar dehydrogenase n=1 Tax=uncultured Ruegeria sp. TaxID=259304 RepID=UPI0026369E28|nr:PQQ-dependent sugar dehydrogenase [uncultured Ruegeria sp.]